MVVDVLPIFLVFSAIAMFFSSGTQIEGSFGASILTIAKIPGQHWQLVCFHHVYLQFL